MSKNYHIITCSVYLLIVLLRKFPASSWRASKQQLFMGAYFSFS